MPWVSAAARAHRSAHLRSGPRHRGRMNHRVVKRIPELAQFCEAADSGAIGGRSWTGRPSRASSPRSSQRDSAARSSAGDVVQVIACGNAEIVPFDAVRVKRKLVRYLGTDEKRWPQDFREFDTDTRFVRLIPTSLMTNGLSKMWRQQACQHGVIS
jgi:hypothetical protein